MDIALEVEDLQENGDQKKRELGLVFDESQFCPAAPTFPIKNIYIYIYFAYFCVQVEKVIYILFRNTTAALVHPQAMEFQLCCLILNLCESAVSPRKPKYFGLSR